MNHLIPLTPKRWLAVLAIAAIALVGAGWAIEAASQTERPSRLLVVVDTAGDPQPELVARATAAVRRAERLPGVEAQLRVTSTPTEQLSVTHLFAARGYDAIVGVALDRRVAVEPVASRFPSTRFVLAGERELPRAVAAAHR